MASMDNLRDKLRKSDTGDLQSSSAAKHFQAQSPASAGQTDSLITEIFSEPQKHAIPEFETTATPSPTHTEYTPQTDQLQSASTAKKTFKNPLKNIEVNRRMLMVSLGVAALASLLSMTYLKGIAEPLKGKGRMVEVITVIKDVPPRTELTKEMLSIRKVPADYLAQGALEYKPDMQLLGQVTTTALYKGEVIHSRRVTLPNKNTGITTVIPKEHRAITIRTDSASLINPSTPDRKEYVDVVATIPDPNPVRRGKLITIPVLQRAVVLAVGDNMNADEIRESASPRNSITLAVPEDRINLMVILKGKEQGNFNIIPRSPNDTSTMPEKYTITEIEDALQGKFEAEKPEPKPTAKPAAVEKPAAEPPAPKLVDLSAPARSTYRAPARNTYRPPARRAPVVRSAPKAAPVRRAPAPVRRAPVVIQNGKITQGG